jgi:hypothetical protein
MPALLQLSIEEDAPARRYVGTHDVIMDHVLPEPKADIAHRRLETQPGLSTIFAATIPTHYFNIYMLGFHFDGQALRRY